MKITEKQEKILNTLICERLSDNKNNEALIKDFRNEKGASIVGYLKEKAYKEDQEGSKAFYIVKTKEDDVLMFFSLKCGALFEPFNEDSVKKEYDELLLIQQAFRNADLNKQESEEAIKKLNDISKDKGVSISTVLNSIIKGAKNKQEILENLRSDKEIEINENINRVFYTFPSVELVHFCTNEKAKDKWNEFDMNRPMGEVLFWKIIVPKILSVQKIVGCEYVFLFAADLSEDRTLINYYNVSLKFDNDVGLGTNKPLYDFACAFMCQKLSDLLPNRDRYFNNFNISENEDVV